MAQRLPPLSPKYPWFVAQNLEANHQIFYNLHHPLSHYHRCQIPDLLGKRIRGCFHASWVLLSSNDPRDVIWSLWNPLTSNIINLPPLNHPVDIASYCLSAPPEHLNSLLLLTTSNKPNFLYSRLGRRKDFRWTESTYAKQVRILTGYDALLYSLTCCNAKVYAYMSDSTSNPCNLLLVEVRIVVNDRKRKKLGEVVITLLPILKFPCPNYIGCAKSSFTMKGSFTELFLIILCLKYKPITVVVVDVFKLDMNNKTWQEIEDLNDTILYVNLATINSRPFNSPAIASSEFGGYIHIIPDHEKIIYSYHVKDKTISLSSMPYLEETNHVSAWAMLECTGLEGDRFHVDCKQKKEGNKEDELVIRSVKGNHEVESHQLNFPFHGLEMKDFCVGVECLKLSTLPYSGYECRLKSDGVDSKQENDKDVDIIVRSDENVTHLLNLPRHVLEMVMEFSVGVEYLKFRSTCKRCHLAAPLIQWNNGKVSKRLQEYSLRSPWVIVFNKVNGIITFTDPLFGDKYFMKAPEELICDFLIKYSRYGWLLILKPDKSLVFFNPFTSDIRELPHLPHYLDVFSFSAPATSPDCMVVGITMHWLYYHVCIHFVGGEPSWRKIHLDVTRGEMFDSLTFYGQDLYALRDDGGLDVFKEIGREGHSWVRNVAQAPTSCGTTFQMRCEQHMLRVSMGRFGESVEVFKLNDYTQKWVKINGLGKHVIFICGTSSFCIDAKTPQMENKIYLIRSPIVYYSLETCRFHTFNNTNIQDSFGNLYGIKYHLAPHGWIEPSWV